MSSYIGLCSALQRIIQMLKLLQVSTFQESVPRRDLIISIVALPSRFCHHCSLPIQDIALLTVTKFQGRGFHSTALGGQNVHPSSTVYQPESSTKLNDLQAQYYCAQRNSVTGKSCPHSKSSKLQAICTQPPHGFFNVVNTEFPQDPLQVTQTCHADQNDAGAMDLGFEIWFVQHDM